MRARQTPETTQVDFGFPNTRIPVEIWTREGANNYHLQGTLTYNGQPVAGALLRTNIYRLPTPTGDDGAFELKGDKTVLQRQVLTAYDLTNATIDGSPLDDDAITAIEAASVEVESIFEIEVEPLTIPADTADATISGSMMFKGGETPVPAVQLWGFVLSGTVTDAEGNPLGDANVSIRDDEGETWSLSTITGDTGEYMLRFYPLGGAFQMRVAQGSKTFETDQETVFNPETSAMMDIIVHTDMGMAMGTGPDGAWEITDIPGAEYVGFITGIADGDAPVKDAAVTLPDDTGAFTITLPALPAGSTYTFFQERFRVFADEPLLPGGVVPPELIPDKLESHIPMGIEPAITIE